VQESGIRPRPFTSVMLAVFALIVSAMYMGSQDLALRLGAYIVSFFSGLTIGTQMRRVICKEGKQ